MINSRNLIYTNILDLTKKKANPIGASISLILFIKISYINVFIL